jgi:hypothetical protein
VAPVTGNPDEEYFSTTLPEDLLVELVSDRLQDMSDCQKGVVFDGLVSLFTTSETIAANILLRAINNRKYIYNVLCKYDFDALTEFNAKIKLEQEQADLLAQQKQFE